MTAILSYLVEHVYQWVIKLTIVLIILGLVQLFLSIFLPNLNIIALWWLNQTYYKVMTYQSALMMQQFMVISITFTIFMWIAGPHHSPHAKHSPSKS